jgi:hypothetical protein
MKDAWPYIIGVAQLIGFLLLYLHQRNIIKEQKEALHSITSFHQIFDLNKVKDYVGIISDKHELELTELKKRLEESKDDVGGVTDFWLSQWSIQNNRIRELTFIAMYTFQKEYVKEEREKAIRRLTPLNSESLLFMFEEMYRKKPEFFN